MIGTCPNHSKVKYFFCPKCNKAFKYQNQKLVELPNCRHLTRLNIENRGKCCQKVILFLLKKLF